MISSALARLTKLKKEYDKEVAARIKDESAYLAGMLRQTAVRAKSQDKKDKKSGNANYIPLAQENLVWLPNPNGGPPTTDGTTVKEFLQQIKSGKVTERVTRRVKSYKGKYARPKGGFKRGQKRTWAKKQVGAEYDKEYTRTTQKEKDYVAKLKADERKLRRKLKQKDSKKLRKLELEIAKLEREANEKPKKKRTATRLTEKREKYNQKRMQMARERELKARAKAKPKHTRIVGEIQKPEERTFIRSIRPGMVRTWYGDGGPEKFLGTSWRVVKKSDVEFEIAIHPLDTNDRFLKIIEEGGSFDPKPILNGYTIIFSDGSGGKTWNQKRVKFIPHTIDKKSATVKPRHFVAQTLERFNKRRLQSINTPLSK